MLYERHTCTYTRTRARIRLAVDRAVAPARVCAGASHGDVHVQSQILPLLALLDSAAVTILLSCRTQPAVVVWYVWPVGQRRHAHTYGPFRRWTVSYRTEFVVAVMSRLATGRSRA